MIVLLLLYIILVITTLRKADYGLACYFVIRLCIPPTCRLFDLSFNTICLVTYVLLFVLFYLKNISLNTYLFKTINKNIFLLFNGVLLLSFFALIVPIDFQLKSLFQLYITEFMPAVLLLLVVRTRKQLNHIIIIIAYAALFNCVYGILTFFVDNNPIYDSLSSVDIDELYAFNREEGRFGFIRKAEGIYGKLNGKISMSLMSLLFFTFFYNKDIKNKGLKNLLLFSAILVNVLTTQRSGLFGIIIFCAIVINIKQLLQYLKTAWVVLLIIIIAIILVPQLQGFRDFIVATVFIFSDTKQMELGSSGSSIAMRLDQLSTVWEMIKMGALQGLGYSFSQYRVEFSYYNNDSLLGLESFLLKLLIEIGLIGMTLWIYFFYKMFNLTYKLQNKYRNKSYIAFLLSYIIVIVITDTGGTLFMFLAFSFLNLIKIKTEIVK